MEIGALYYVKGHVDASVFAAEVEELVHAPVDVEQVKHGYGRAVPVKVDGWWTSRVQLQGRRGHGASAYTFVDVGTLPKHVEKTDTNPVFFERTAQTGDNGYECRK